MTYSTDLDPPRALQLGIDRVTILLDQWGQLGIETQSPLIPFSVSALAIDPFSDVDECSILVSAPLAPSNTFLRQISVDSPYVGNLPAGGFQLVMAPAAGPQANQTNKAYLNVYDPNDSIMAVTSDPAFGTALVPASFNTPQLRVTAFITAVDSGAIAVRRPYYKSGTSNPLLNPGGAPVVQVWPFFGRSRARVVAVLAAPDPTVAVSMDLYLTGIRGGAIAGINPDEALILGGPLHITSGPDIARVTFDVDAPDVDWLMLKAFNIQSSLGQPFTPSVITTIYAV